MVSLTQLNTFKRVAEADEVSSATPIHLDYLRKQGKEPDPTTQAGKTETREGL